MGRTKTWDGGAHAIISKRYPHSFCLKKLSTTYTLQFFSVCSTVINSLLCCTDIFRFQGIWLGFGFLLSFYKEVCNNRKTNGVEVRTHVPNQL